MNNEKLGKLFQDSANNLNMASTERLLSMSIDGAEVLKRVKNRLQWLRVEIATARTLPQELELKRELNQLRRVMIKIDACLHA